MYFLLLINLMLSYVFVLTLQHDVNWIIIIEQSIDFFFFKYEFQTRREIRAIFTWRRRLEEIFIISCHFS